MKILMLSSYLPYPLFSGGHVRLFNIIKHLSKNHEITLICEKRSHQNEKDVLEVKNFCRDVIAVDREKQWSLTNILKTGASFYPFLLIGHKSKLLQEKITDILTKDKFDLLHIETFYIMQNLNFNMLKLPVVLAEHNIEHLVYRRFANHSPVFIKPFLYLDVLKMKYWEEYYWRKATKLVAVSEEERKIMKRKDVEVVQNGVDKNLFKIEGAGWRTKFKQKKKVLFIGDFKWLKNRDAADWILKKIWPLIEEGVKAKRENKKLEIDVKLWIVGKNIPAEIKNLTESSSVIFDENAPKNTPEIFRQADILLSPVRIGGGTSFKILEAMASGVPVITTRLGIEGIKAESGEDVLVSDSEEDLADYVLELILNEKMYEKISKNGRKLIEKEYDWEPIVKKLEKVYESAVNNF